uniref:claspin-like isoform X2 n=1 Tax=Osmia lignaria TaxID=473952 RepID=UPI0014782BDA|nr:claspin-like isoform X2 [Osmia lignaria]
MNRLKFVLGINVPCRIPSSTSIISENHTKEICKKHSSEVQLRSLYKPGRFFSSRTRRTNDFRSFHYAGPSRNEMLYASQRIKLKPDLISSKRTPLGRNYPVEFVQRRRNSTYQSKKSSIGKHHFVQSNPKTLETAKDRRGSKIYEKYEAASFLEKEPRTYAQMIASYSQTMYTETGSGILKDGLSTAMVNGVHRSPFSTSSAASLKWKNRSKGVKNGCLRVTNPNTLNQEAKFSSDTSTMTYECRNDRKNFIMSDFEESGKLERASSSYATIIERYSNELEFDDWNSSPLPKRNAPMDLNDFPALMTNTKHRPMKLRSDRNERITSGESKKTEEKSQTDWISKMEDVIKDLKKITSKNEMVDSKSSEKWALQSVNEHAEWMDRVVGAHKKGKLRKGDSDEPKSSTTMQESVVDAANENRGSKSNPITSYINRGSIGSSTSSSSQGPTGTATGSTKQPQIELRMTPSQNESVVSINVDELAKTAGTSAKEQLSVVISNNAKRDTSASNVRSNFDSMQISISENTVPVKQLEFSINGKPVSELKSIVARANKLDVFSSMDKVEIRIPQTENTFSKQQTNTMRTGTNPSQVLNLQIAAKFNEPRSQQPKDTGIKTSTTATPSSVPSSSSNPPKPTPTPTQVPPYKLPRMQNFASKTNDEAAKITKSPEDVATTKKINDSPLEDSREKIGTLSAVESDEGAVQRANAKVASNASQPSSMNDNSRPVISNDDRTSSNIIPWWSSEDSFRKIKKKGDTSKNVSAFDEKLMKKIEGDTGAERKFDQTYKPGGQFIDLVNVPKLETPAKDLTPKNLLSKEKKNSSDAGNFQKTEPPVKDSATKPVPKENEDSFNSSNENFRAVRVRSLRQSARIKRSSGARASNQMNRVKKVRYRVKRPRTTKVVNKGIEKPIVSAVRSPKIIKYVPVNAKRISGNEKSETKAIAAGPKNEEASKAGTKVEKVAEDASTTGKTNVQDSNTVFKTKDLKKPANESADISATSSAAKEQGERDESRRDLPSRRESIEDEPDQRIKQILKSLKPIEKRKDGTLIDYGVVLPSRKSSTKFGQVSKSRSISKFDMKKEPSNQEKIVEPQKVTSTKKKMLTEPKSEAQVKIVEPEKISSVRKPNEITDFEKKYTKNELSTSKGKKETSEEKSVISVKKNNLIKHDTPKSMESKKNSDNQSEKVKTTQIEGTSFKANDKPKNVSSEDRINSSKVTAPRDEGSQSPLRPKNKEKPLEGTFSVQSSKASTKSSDTNVTNVSKSQSADKSKNITSPEKQDSKITKSESQEKAKLKGSYSVPPSKVSIKVSDINANVSKSQSPDKSKNITTSPEKQDSKITKSESQEKAKLKGSYSVPPAKVSIKVSDTNAKVSKSQLPDKSKNITTSPEKQDSKITKSESQEKAKLKGSYSVPPSKISIKDSKIAKPESQEKRNLGSLPVQPSKISIKPSNTNITNVSKSQSPDKPKNITTSSENQDSKITKPEFQEKKNLGPLPVQPSKISIKPSNTNITNVSKSHSLDKSKNIAKPVEKQNSKSTKSEFLEKIKSGPLPVQPFKDSIKASDTNITNFSKLKPLNEPMSRARSAEQTESKRTLKSVVPEKVPLEGTIPSSRGLDRTAARIDPLPLMGTIVSPSPQKSSDKGTKNDGKSEESNVRSEKKVIDTIMAPLEGTINNESTKKLDNLMSLDSTRKGKKTISEIIKQKKEELGTKSSTNSSSSKSGGSSGPNGPANPPTGPAGLRSSRMFTVSLICSKTTVSCMPEESDRIEEEMCNGISNQDYNQETKLYSNETKRSEKDILYSSWLQRFENKLCDGKIV